MNMPTTITYPETFMRTAPPGFDGVFDWTWMDGCFGKGSKIKPMDIDAAVERRGHLILFETKGAGVPVPDPQIWTLKALYRRGQVTVVFIQGKEEPEAAMVWCERGFKNGVEMENFAKTNRERMHNFVKDWYQHVEGAAS